ncbi:MAG: sodium/solute symporter [Planctomycetes bacterium]|nr:sodium/solute symporter [Planctomycetota bacterium]
MIAVVVFGVWISGRQRNASDFTVGDRNIPWWAVLFSIVATETSTVTFLSVPAIAYAGNLTFWQLSLGYVLGRYVIVYLLLPLYFRGELFTAYQVLHQRFGGATKQAASLLFIITRSLADGLRLFLTAIVLREMTGVDLSLCVVLTGVATIVYTYLGGIKAVVWTDVVQFFVYVGGAMLAGAILLEQIPGGLAEVVSFAQSQDKLQIFDFSWDLSSPYTFWAGVIGGAFVSLGSHGADQLMVQRYLCARNEREAGRALALSGWVVLVQFGLFLALGLGLACFYASFPNEQFDRPDQVFARFIVTHLPVGAVGITLAAVFSAAMSTLSSSLNSLATATVNDLYLPMLKPQASSEHQLAVTRWFTVLFGAVQIGVGIAGQRLQSNVITSVLTIAAFTTGIILGVFFLAIVSKRASQTAALVALVGGLVMMTAISFYPTLASLWMGPNKTPVAGLAWPWLAVVGSLGTLLLGLAADRVVNGRGATDKGADFESEI